MEVNGYKIEPGAQLAEADLSGANLTNANLVSADLRDANLEGANLTNAKLVSADLRGTNLKYTNLLNAKLVSADLRGANLEGANLTNAKLVSADLRGTNLPNEDWGDPGKSYTHWFDDQAGANFAVVIQNQTYGELSPAAWHTDPSGRFELRYWNGKEWTEHVVREGRQLADPPQPITQGNKTSEKETGTFWARLKNFFDSYGGPLRESECPDCGSTFLRRIPFSAPYGQGGWNGHQHPGSPAHGEHMVGLLIECEDCGRQWPY